jgi:hypothetical protein
MPRRRRGPEGSSSTDVIRDAGADDDSKPGWIGREHELLLRGKYERFLVIAAQGEQLVE